MRTIDGANDNIIFGGRRMPSPLKVQKAQELRKTESKDQQGTAPVTFRDMVSLCSSLFIISIIFLVFGLMVSEPSARWVVVALYPLAQLICIVLWIRSGLERKGA